jgi:hypothetical protein
MKTTKTKGFMKDTNQSHDKGRPNFSPNHETWKPRTRTQIMQDVGSNKALLQKHENNKTKLWCKIIPKICDE